jgi:hypothetical protein
MVGATSFIAFWAAIPFDVGTAAIAFIASGDAASIPSSEHANCVRQTDGHLGRIGPGCVW